MGGADYDIDWSHTAITPVVTLTYGDVGDLSFRAGWPSVGQALVQFAAQH